MRAQLDRARVLLRKRYADDPVVHSLLLFQVAGRYAELNEHKRTAELMQEIETLSTRANEPSVSAMVECAKAYFLLREGKNDAAKSHVTEGLRLMEGAVRLVSQAGFECYRSKPCSLLPPVSTNAASLEWSAGSDSWNAMVLARRART